MVESRDSLREEQVLAVSLNHTKQELQKQRMALSKKMNDTKAKFQEAKRLLLSNERSLVVRFSFLIANWIVYAAP